ncbi:mitogen-activated protein kinase 9-like [Nicotiana tabacum]|uniref:Mitogen-activated protein kinase 9-like n=2 Tax=Nicotiana TaxID=4085 RepID=A0AC58SWY1_TOBAC|nr:PREDICTED: mitogen-activated protein kinase 9-like [Nicotiana sylvestris]
MVMDFKEFFTEYGEAHQYEIQEVVGKGSYGVVAAAIDTHTGEKVAIKKINDVFEHASEATRILREIKLLRLLRHPDIVEIKHILLPPCPREFKDIYVVFELMECDLQHVIKANDSLTPEHYQFFMYQLLRGLKYMHTANVFHRDLKPKNILANADCKLKICDFGLARVSLGDTPSAVFWTDYVATRWYRAPELCGSFFSKYTPAVDIWSLGCIFAEMLTGKPLFPGKNAVHQLDVITDLLGSPSTEAISRIKNEKARRYLSSMKRKAPISLSEKFPHIDPLALRLLERLIAFDPKDRPSAEEALAHPYFRGLANKEQEPSSQTISKFEFDFDRRKLGKEDIRELIYREILEYHPQMLKEYLHGNDHTHFMYPSGVDCFKQQFDHLEGHSGRGGSILFPRRYASLPRERVCASIDEETDKNGDFERQVVAAVAHRCLPSPPSSPRVKKLDAANTFEGQTETSHCAPMKLDTANTVEGHRETGHCTPKTTERCMLRSSSISFSKCVGAIWDCEDTTCKPYQNGISRSSNKPAALYA